MTIHIIHKYSSSLQLFVRVLFASAVRVSVCGVCVCLGALNKKIKK